MSYIEDFDNLPNEAYVRMKAVQALLGDAPRVTIERWVREGNFPRGIRLGGGFRAWQVGELREFLKSKAA